MYRVVKQSEGSVRKVADNKTVVNLITKEITEAFSLAVIEAQDYSEEETTTYNRAYYILEGNLEIISDGIAQTLQEGDSCFINENTTYKMQGTFKTIVINQPAYGASPMPRAQF